MSFIYPCIGMKGRYRRAISVHGKTQFGLKSLSHLVLNRKYILDTQSYKCVILCINNYLNNLSHNVGFLQLNTIPSWSRPSYTILKKQHFLMHVHWVRIRNIYNHSLMCNAGIVYDETKGYPNIKIGTSIFIYLCPKN